MAKKFISQFTGEEIDARLAAVSEKVGYTFFNSSDGNTLYSFASEETYNQWVEEGMNGNSELIIDKTPFSFEGTMRRLTVVNLLTTQNPYFTTNKKSAILRFGYESQYKGITEPDWQDFDENAKVTVEVDKGFTGEFVKVVDGQQLLNGKNFEVDVYQHIAIGDNKVRVTIVGETTATKGTLTYTVALTSMYMLPSSTVNWHLPLIQGERFYFGGFNIGGTVNKTVKVRVTYHNNNGEVTYTDYEDYIGSKIYENVTYSFPFNLATFPLDNTGAPITGVCKVDIWAQAGSANTDTLTYYLMFVSEEQKNTAKLACINDVREVKNGSTAELFQFAVYDGSAGNSNADVRIGFETNEFYNQTLEVDTKTKQSIIVEVNQDSEAGAFELNASVNVVGGSAMYATIPVDNSANYPAESGYTFYFNSANRSNGESNKNIVNEVNKARIPSVYTNISWVDGLDGYTTDEGGLKGLRIPAKCRAEFDLFPLSTIGQQGVTIEMQYKVSYPSDTQEPIISIASKRDRESFVNNDFHGLLIAPNTLVLNKTAANTRTKQSYNLKDNEIVHLVITIVPNYKQYNGNLAQVYVNGSKKISFEYSDSSDFILDSKLVLGSQTADLMFYKMRIYPQGFTWESIFKNYVNTYTGDKSSLYASVDSIVTESFNLDYDKCVKAGLNTMVIEMLTEKGRIPDNIAKESGNSNVCITIHNAIEGEYDEEFKQFFNIGSDGYVIENELIEGQGTTAMGYARWNFRWKMSKNHNKRRITAKKNVASSMQSHKMGATRMFNDVFFHLYNNNGSLSESTIKPSNGDNDIPTNRVAIYQYPVFGFQKTTNEEGEVIYEPIGLYTIGPDKGDKETFGYDNDETLIRMEGSDHDKAGVGFEYPWDKMQFKDEFLGGYDETGVRAEAWEIGDCFGLDLAEKDSGYNREAVQQVLNDEFRDAYEVAYNNDPYVIGLTDSEWSEMMSDPSAWRIKIVSEGEYAGRPYSNFKFYKQREYILHYFNLQSGKFVSTDTNVVTDLNLDISGKSESEIQDMIRKGRRARFRENAGDYWNVWDSIYHYTFMLFLGATDNFMKNTYPYKFYKIEDGGRWRWNQDDLDTILDVNNRGAAVKGYSIMVGDRNDSGAVYVGDNSVFWTLIRESFSDEVREMGRKILGALRDISGNSSGNYIEGVLQYFKDRWFAYAQDYFGIAGYNEDTEWTYEDVWGMEKAGNPAQDNPPLEQALGNHYEAEYQWIFQRILFFSSMVGFGDYESDKQNYAGMLSYRAGAAHTFQITPAMDMSLAVAEGSSKPKNNFTRVKAGTTADLSYSNLSDTQIYLKGFDYMSDISDLSRMRVGASSSEIIFSSKMLNKINIGIENPVEENYTNNVYTNVTKLTITNCPSLELINAVNARTIAGSLDLRNSPRITSVNASGTNITEVVLPNGSKIERLNLPASTTSISFVRLPNLNPNDGFTIDGYANLQKLRLEENKHIDGFEMLKEAYKNSGSLAYLRIIDFDYSGTAEDVTMLKSIATDKSASGNNKFHGIDSNGNVTDSTPVIQGTLRLTTPVYKSELEEVENLYNKETLNIESDKYYIEFEDPEVKRIILEAGIGDGYGVMQTGTQYVDADEVTAQFRGTSAGTGIFQQAPIKMFNELQYFTSLYGDMMEYMFAGNSTIEEVTFPNLNGNYLPVSIFNKTTSLKKVHCQEGQKITQINHRAFEGSGIESFDFDISGITQLGTRAFAECSNLNVDISINSVQIINGEYTFYKSGITSFIAPNLTYWQYTSHLGSCTNLYKLVIPKLQTIPSSLCSGCSNLKEVVINENAQTIDSYAFYNCFSENSNIDLIFTNLQTIGVSAFAKSKLRKITIYNIETILNSYVWSGCSLLVEANIPDVKKIGDYIFEDCVCLSKVNASSLEEIGIWTFSDCSSLTNIDLPNVKILGSNSFRNSGILTVTMPKVEVIGSSAFLYTNLTGDYEFMHLTSIGAESFRATEINSITTNIVTAIKGNCFRSCSKLVSYTQVSDVAVETSDYAFSECSNLKTVNIKNLRVAGTRAFSSCSSLQYVNFEGTEEMKGNAIMACPSLNMAVVAPRLHTMDINFNDGTPITKFIAPNLKGTIVQLSLRSCNNMTEFVVGNVTNFESNTVKNCSKLQRIVIYLEETPQGLGSTVFDNTNGCPIYIPDAFVDTVKTLTGWTNVASRIKSFSEGNIPLDKNEWFNTTE